MDMFSLFKKKRDPVVEVMSLTTQICSYLLSLYKDVGHVENSGTKIFDSQSAPNRTKGNDRYLRVVNTYIGIVSKYPQYAPLCNKPLFKYLNDGDYIELVNSPYFADAALRVCYLQHRDVRYAAHLTPIFLIVCQNILNVTSSTFSDLRSFTDLATDNSLWISKWERYDDMDAIAGGKLLL